METQEKLQYICRQFRLPGEIILYRFIPNGHINTAYYVALYDGWEVRQYLVQRVNWHVFKNPDNVMHNIDLITRHIMAREKTLERRRRLHFHHTAEGQNYFIYQEGDTPEFWRVTNFIENSVSFETAGGDPRVLRMSGRAFGKFMRQLEDFDASQLMEAIPHFHDTPWRLRALFRAAEEDVCGRAAEVQPELELIQENAAFGNTLSEQLAAGVLPLRVTHNDTKTNNVLFDRKTLDPLVVIDLDTCMAGLACHDFGDTIRFAACTAPEDERDPEKMKLDLTLFRAYAEGYLSETGDILSRAETESLATGAAVITLELASRFLGDYLEGDRYFRVDYPEHNLVRTRAQLALFRDMMLHMGDMQRIIREVCGRKEGAG